MGGVTPEGERLAAARAELESATNAAMIAAVRMVNGGEQKTVVASRFGITRTTLDNWIRVLGHGRVNL